jgi:hypothetical protein
MRQKTNKTQSVLIGMTALALVFGFVVMGCDTPLQNGGSVKISYDKAPGVAKVDVKVTTANLVGESNKGVIISCDAVENAGGYQGYVQQEGKKTLIPLDILGNSKIYAPTDGAITDNSDIDKYSLLVPLTNKDILHGQKHRFGVQTIPFNPQRTEPSDIVWSEYIKMP